MKREELLKFKLICEDTGSEILFTEGAFKLGNDHLLKMILDFYNKEKEKIK